MPFVNIRVTKEAKPVSTEQKKELINGVSDLLVRVLGKNKASIVVIIDEIEPDNYGLGGTSIEELYILCGDVIAQLKEKGVRVYRSFVGE